MTKNEFIQRAILSIANNSRSYCHLKESAYDMCKAATYLAEVAETFTIFDEDITPAP